MLGQVGVTTPNLSLDKVSGAKLEDSENSWNAGINERSFNDQLFFANANIFMGPTSLDQQAAIHELRVNSDSTFASNGHTVDASPDASLLNSEPTSFIGSIVNKNIATKTYVEEHGATIDDGPIGVSNFNVSTNFPTPGGKRAITEPNILDSEKLSLVPFMQLPTVFGHGDHFVEPSSLFNTASGLGQNENQHDQSALQHSLSFGSQTLTPDWNVVNYSDALSSKQLALLSKATSTIDNLPDRYLA